MDLSARALWLVIESYTNSDGTNAFPSIRTLQDVTGRGRNWVYEQLAVLESAGWLKRGKIARNNGHLGNLFTVIYPPAPRPEKRDRGSPEKRDTTGESITGGDGKALRITFPLLKGIRRNPPD